MSNSIHLLFLIPTYLLTHLLMYNIQFISSKQYFYGVYIKNIEIEESEKKRIDKEYKKNLNLAILIALLFMLLNEFTLRINIGISVTLTMTIYIALAYIYLRRYYFQVKMIKNDYLLTHSDDYKKLEVSKRKVAIDTKFLSEKAKIKKKFTKLFAICLLISLVSVVYLAMNYNNLPDTIITHWGPNGEPDGFAQKNFKNVFTISMIDIGLVVLMSFMAIESLGTRIYLDSNNLEENRKKALKYINRLGYCFFFLVLSIQSITSTTPYFMVNESSIPMPLLMAVIILPIFISILLTYYFIMLSTLKSKEKQVNTSDSDDEKWLYGIFYYNEDDPSTMVEKRFGAGWTVNLASPKGKALMLLTFVIIIGSLILGFV